MIKIYNKKKVLEFINITLKKRKDITFVSIMEEIYASDNYLLQPTIIPRIINLSSGTSTLATFPKFLDVITYDILNNPYYKEYSSPGGSQTVRKALSIAENIRLDDSKVYTENDFCITEGATGAISAIIEYISNKFPHSEVIIPIPTYYLFSFATKYRELTYKEVNILNSKDKSKAIIDAITNRTKVIIICQPNNPTGTLYTKKEIKKILEVAHKKNLFVLFDEVFFGLIFKTSNNIVFSDQMALKQKCLNNIIIIRSYSKDKNLPGFRIGFVFSKNQEIIEYVKKIQEQRVFFSTGSNFKSLMFLESFLRTVQYLLKQNKNISIEEGVEYAIQKFKQINYIQHISPKSLIKIFEEYLQYEKSLISTYNTNYHLVIKELKNEISNISKSDAAFNTFVKFKIPKRINYFDYCLNLYLTTGIKIQLGPYFGLDQKTWEEDPNLGLWVRITFALDRISMKDALKQLLEFNKTYTSRNLEFLKTNLQF